MKKIVRLFGVMLLAALLFSTMGGNAFAANDPVQIEGDNTFAFKTPSSNASTLVVSGASQPKLYKSVSPSGTAIFNGMAYYPASYSGGSEVTLKTYSR